MTDNQDPLQELERLLDAEKEEDSNPRISVVINHPLPPPPPPTNSIFPPQIDPKSPIARWVMTIILALAAVGGAVRMIQDLL